MAAVLRVRRRDAGSILLQSHAEQKDCRATFRSFFREQITLWFRHPFPLSPDGVPGGFREILAGSRGPLDVPSGPLKESSSMIPLPGFVPKDAASTIPHPGLLLQNATSRIPPPGFLLKVSTSRTPPSGFLFTISPSGFLLPGFPIQDSNVRFLLQHSTSCLAPAGFLFQDSFSRIP